MRNFIVLVLIILTTSLYAQRRKGVASGTTTNHQVTVYKDVFQRKVRRSQNINIGRLPFLFRFSSKARYEYRYSKKSGSSGNFAGKRRYKGLVRQAKKASKGGRHKQNKRGARRKSK